MFPENVFALLLPGVTMIGAMPAVAVRHERRKQEKRNKRPSQLYLAGYGLKHPSPPSRGSSPTPSPLQSPPTQNDDVLQEIYVCGKVMTHFIPHTTLCFELEHLQRRDIFPCLHFKCDGTQTNIREAGRRFI